MIIYNQRSAVRNSMPYVSMLLARASFYFILGGIALVVLIFFLVLPAEAATFSCPGATQISAASRYAWNEAIGWIDFGDASGCVETGPPEMRGYAFSSVGEIALNCTDWSPSLCSTSNFKVLRNASTNDLSGYAWNDTIGWVSFNCDQTPVGGTNSCATSNYKVWVDAITGKYRGYAWNDVVGWISFSCLDPGLCTTSLYRVGLSVYERTGELTSAVFDTGVSEGAAFNTIMWQGSQPVGTSVKFRFASSNCSNGATNPTSCTTGSWSYLGPDGSGTTYYEAAGPNVAIKLNRAYHNNHRYYRYKVFLSSTTADTPVVDDVIVNWSP